MKKLRLAVLISGSGTTLENLFNKSAAAEIDAEVVVVVSSRADALGLERARKRNVAAYCVERREFRGCRASEGFLQRTGAFNREAILSPAWDVGAFSEAVFDKIDPCKVDLICLAGFMSRIEIPLEYENRVMNVHPAMLPAFGGKGFYGHHVHEAVLKSGCKTTGCTVHFVNNEYDAGPIILQHSVPVLEGDTPETLAARVQEAEREVFPDAVQLFAEGRLSVVDGKVNVRY